MCHSTNINVTADISTKTFLELLTPSLGVRLVWIAHVRRFPYLSKADALQHGDPFPTTVQPCNRTSQNSNMTECHQQVIGQNHIYYHARSTYIWLVAARYFACSRYSKIPLLLLFSSLCYGMSTFRICCMQPVKAEMENAIMSAYLRCYRGHVLPFQLSKPLSQKLHFCP